MYTFAFYSEILEQSFFFFRFSIFVQFFLFDSSNFGSNVWKYKKVSISISRKEFDTIIS